MNRTGLANAFGFFMLIGGVPCVLAIAVFFRIGAAHESGISSGGNALGLMMMSLWAYGIALASCVAGLLYFGYAALKYRMFPTSWHRLVICWSICLVIGPVLYLFAT
ncbi:hypothetical protein IP91_01120 [Pseudoduganella lurida]|uniref:Uncharacterized protein n=1 Tax=Pseudoduganella lurida TaxID=1036180 RepID=A0A562RLZ2_9BURK|nr:hypothetical protein [Pseudoduganella lurida]TWI70042.1 hypothetical protein IP91_01120 [Pseudoduganella lurida]